MDPHFLMSVEWRGFIKTREGLKNCEIKSEKNTPKGFDSNEKKIYTSTKKKRGDLLKVNKVNSSIRTPESESGNW